MLFTIERGKLLNSLTHVVRSVGNGKTIAILATIRIIVTESSITLTASDTETEMTAVIENEGNTPGECCVPGRRFFEVVKTAAPDNLLKIGEKNGFLVIKQKRILQKLQMLPAENFPEFGDFTTDAQQLIIDSKQIVSLIKRVIGSIAKDDVRYYLNGLLMRLNDNLLTLVGTDGHRLSVTDYAIDYSRKDKLDFILPAKSIAEITNIADQGDNLTFVLSSANLQINVDNLRLKIKLIDGKYPEYNRIIPDEDRITGRVLVNRYELLNAVNRAIPIIKDKNIGNFAAARITCESEESLTLFVSNASNEESLEPLEMKLSGELFETNLNLHYLKDAISAIETDNVIVNYHGESAGIVVVPDSEGDDFKNIIMPMRM